MQRRVGRFAPAFLLLLLAEKDGYGSQLLERLSDWIPRHRMDSAIVYRSLASLEREGLIQARVDASSPGPVRKVYRISKQGRRALNGYRESIHQCAENLQLWLTRMEGHSSPGIPSPPHDAEASDR